jgi:hypothetical protein
MASLELDEQLAFQERQWRWERIGWVVIALVIIAGLLGAFGTGPLASATVRSTDDGLAVSYERVVRHQGEAEFRLHIDPALIPGREVDVWFSTSTVTAVRIESVAPEPSEVEAGADRTTWTFAVDPSAGPVTIIFHVTPQEMGWRTVELGVAGGTSLSFHQLVLP